MSAEAKMNRRKPRCWKFICLLALGIPCAAEAVIFYSTADPTHNTTAPGGALSDSGWQYQGTWGIFLGTSIAPNYFLTAGHVGGSVGDKFRFRGLDYTTTATFDDPNSDLRLWRICGSFPDYAQVYSSTTEIGQTVVVLGRGTQRGAEVVVSGPLGGSRGWQWGPGDGLQRWGTNVVTAIINGDTIFPMGGLGGGTVGDLLKCTFDSTGGADEAHLSGGDSGGGLFIKDGAVWKLAGINYAVDGPYNTNATGPGFMAAIFNESGLYKGGEGKWSLTLAPTPGSFYSTRVSAHVAWINSVLQSAQSDPAPTLVSASDVNGQYVTAPGATVNPSTKTVTVPVPVGTQFYRLQACGSLRITGVTVQGPNLVFTYQ